MTGGITTCKLLIDIIEVLILLQYEGIRGIVTGAQLFQCPKATTALGPGSLGVRNGCLQ